MKKRLISIFVLTSCFVTAVSFAQSKSSNPDLIVQAIEITGQTKTRANVITNYLTFHVNGSISPEKIEASWQLLKQTNFFKNVEIYTRPGKEKGLVIAIIEIEDRRRPYFEFAGGHSDLDGWYFVPASFRFDNQFGRGNLLDIQIYLSDRTSKFSINYKHPYLFDGSSYFSTELYGGGRQYIHYLNGLQAQQDVNFTGLKMHIGGNEGLFRFIKLGIQVEKFEPKNELKFSNNDSVVVDLQIPPDLRPNDEMTKASAFTLALGFDGRDNIYYPKKGFWGAAIYEKATKELNSEFEYSRVLLDGRFYQKIFGTHVLALNVKNAYASEDSPFFKRFYLGGANSLRGFSERRLTPVGYGTKLFLGNIEYRFALTNKMVAEPPVFGVLFYSQGGLWQNDAKINTDEMFKSLGFGLRFRLPILGLTRVDFAFPTTVLDDEDFQLHISLGQTF